MFAFPSAIDKLPNKDAIFQQVGEALYHCQCFEGVVSFALHVYKQIRCEADPSWQMDEDMIHELGRIASEGWAFRKATLGQLLKELRHVVFIDPETEEALSKAVDVRNHLIHRYFLSPEWEAVFGARIPQEAVPLKEIVEQVKTAYKVMEVIVQSLQRKLDEARRESWGQGR